MSKNGIRRLLICMSLVMALGIIFAGSAGAGLFSRSSSHSSVNGSHTTLLIFPFDVDKEIQSKVSASYGEEIGSYLKNMLDDNKAFMVFMFKTRLAPIVRAKEQSELKAAEIDPPYSEDKAKSLKLAQIMSTDMYVVGTVQDVNFDAAKKTAQVTVSAELFSTKTGESKGNFIVTGNADETSKANDQEEMISVAAGKAVDSLRSQIAAAGQPEKKSK